MEHKLGSLLWTIFINNKKTECSQTLSHHTLWRTFLGMNMTLGEMKSISGNFISLSSIIDFKELILFLRNYYYINAKPLKPLSKVLQAINPSRFLLILSPPSKCSSSKSFFFRICLLNMFLHEAMRLNWKMNIVNLLIWSIPLHPV